MNSPQGDMENQKFCLLSFCKIIEDRELLCLSAAQKVRVRILAESAQSSPISWRAMTSTKSAIVPREFKHKQSFSQSSHAFILEVTEPRRSCTISAACKISVMYSLAQMCCQRQHSRRTLKTRDQFFGEHCNQQRQNNLQNYVTHHDFVGQERYRSRQHVAHTSCTAANSMANTFHWREVWMKQRVLKAEETCS